MERKSLGAFIAVLRRASGMTQKELAEKLNVSDKAVSRWERDESAPDLTLIPVIAEIFGVTSDEILRGERKSNSNTDADINPRRTERQLDRLINKTKTRFSICTIVSLCLVLIGFVAALICNLGFTRAIIGFCSAAVFYVAAITTSSIALLSSFSALNAEEYDNSRVYLSKRSIIINFTLSVCLAVVMFAVTLPLGVLSYDAYTGLTAEYWFDHGLVFAIIAIPFCYTAYEIIRRTPSVRIYFPDTGYDKELFPIRRKLIIRLAIMISFTLALQFIWNALASYEVLTRGTRFVDHEEFIDYIETPVDSYYTEDGAYVNIEPVDDPYDSIADELFDHEYVYDKNGDPIFSYYHKNKSVARIKYDWQDDGTLVLITYTHRDLDISLTIKSAVDVLFYIAYASETLLILKKYRKEKKAILQ